MSSESPRADGDRPTDELVDALEAEHGHPVELRERGRWDGDVVATDTGSYRWGTHTFQYRLQVFADGDGHLQLAGVSADPPPAAEAMIADALADRWAPPQIGLALARAWTLNPQEIARTHGIDT